MFLGNGKVKFEFAHVGINAQTPEEGARMKDFFTDVMGYHDHSDPHLLIDLPDQPV